jgi:hypothetical protein
MLDVKQPLRPEALTAVVWKHGQRTACVLCAVCEGVDNVQALVDRRQKRWSIDGLP